MDYGGAVGKTDGGVCVGAGGKGCGHHLDIYETTLLLLYTLAIMTRLEQPINVFLVQSEHKKNKANILQPSQENKKDLH